MRVIFMGTPDFSVMALDAIVAAGHEVCAVYSQPARPAGRGKKDRPSPVAVRADALGLPLRTPTSLRDPAVQAEFAALNADVAVVVAYGLILPQAVLDAPRRGCLNIHASLLPRWRGAAPIHRAIMAGDAQTGICIMQMQAGLDTGPVLTCRAVPISHADTTGDLHDRLAVLGGQMIVQVLEQLPTLTPIPQPETGVTYAAKIDKAEAHIDWSHPAAQVLCQIHGLSPFPGAWFQIGAERIKVLRARLADGAGVAGHALDDRMTIACGQGAVRLEQVQRAGKGPMAAVDFLRGFPIAAGSVLG